jgi:hypothetical protein
MTRKVKVTVILDDSQILFGGVVEGGPDDGERISFMVRPEQGGSAIMLKLREPNTDVYVELP